MPPPISGGGIITTVRGQRPQPAVLDSCVVDKVETDREMAVDDLGCNEEDEENQPFVDEDDEYTKL